jgi:hypothetical protein
VAYLSKLDSTSVDHYRVLSDFRMLLRLGELLCLNLPGGEGPRKKTNTTARAKVFQLCDPTRPIVLCNSPRDKSLF